MLIKGRGNKVFWATECPFFNGYLIGSSLLVIRDRHSAKIEVWQQQPLSPSAQVEMFSFDSLKRGLPLMQLINMDECFIAGEKRDRF